MAIATKISLVVLWLAGCSPTVAAAPEVCVLAPQLEPSPAASAAPPPQALVPLSQPTLFVREPLAELRIEQGGKVLWAWPSTSGTPLPPLEGPLAWPLAPLQPGQSFLVRLRPLGANPDHFATIRLVGAPPQRLREGDGLLRSLAPRPADWLPTIEGLLNRGDRPLATALLFASEGPDEPGLNALRRLVARESCP